MATKHEQILNYIADLAVGEKISVRSIAKALRVSEGTAYRAIKDAETAGIVSTIERVGTIRIEQKPANPDDQLSFAELVEMLDARVLGGESGLNKRLNKFVIGAMTKAAMGPYITQNSLMIVGNREEAQQLALENGAAVLITGGFETSQAVIQLANELALPVLQTNNDTFTVATLINRALSDQAIKQDIVTVASVYTPKLQLVVLHPEDAVADYQQLSPVTVPVVTNTGRLVGVVTPKDVAGKKPSMLIDRVMQRDPLTVKPYLSVATVSHTMQGNGVERLPVVDDSWQLLGMVTQRAIANSLSGTAHQGTSDGTFADQVAQQIEAADLSGNNYQFQPLPMMTNSLGALSFGVLTEVVNQAVTAFLGHNQYQNVLVEQMALNNFRPVPLESRVNLAITALELNRSHASLDVDLTSDGRRIAKAVVTCQLLERN